MRMVVNLAKWEYTQDPLMKRNTTYVTKTRRI